MSTLQRIRNIAQEVREWAEAQDPLYSKHTLCGFCAIASSELHKRLKVAGIEAEMHMSEDDVGAHVFVITADHVVDVTATQFPEFRYEPIVILHEREAQQYWFYNAHQQFSTPAELRRYQVRAKWPQDQIARR
jgi:hypothetical protein